MIEDSALSLKKAYEKGENILEEGQKMLKQSEVITLWESREILAGKNYPNYLRDLDLKLQDRLEAIWG